jgi:uncharacterized protein (TIGR02118 family)
MIKLLIFFRRPKDTEAFEQHFSTTHVPLIASMPNVKRTAVMRVIGAPTGDAVYHLIHEVYFDDMQSCNLALNSDAGRAAGSDLMSWAKDIVTLMFAEVWE